MKKDGVAYSTLEEVIAYLKAKGWDELAKLLS